ncbi:synaptic vesicle transporter [Choiromyces venosus 120613-1]|uniref:Synaptic vesicle transporter n=1 Tax=Choiromyces venosus 120613-1 TaxID=1336337 RepID=A0A3N4J5M1_9PEZI|nr:synaptic vesicle transporter [Choiromyces venosus 120613-1]
MTVPPDPVPPSIAGDEKLTLDDRSSVSDSGINSRNNLTEIETHHSTRVENPELTREKSIVIEKSYSHPLSRLQDNIVGWEGVDDPEDPRNWPAKRKWTVLFLVSSITFISPLASSIFAPGVGFMNEEFGNHSITLSSFVVSIFILGFALGPLVLSPLSEIYGRAPVLDAANFWFVVWQIGCALAPNLESLIIFRLFSGIGGSGCLTIGGGVISDLFPPEQRGKATAIYTIGPLFGPVIGPICGGFVAQRVGWRWVFWVLLIASALASVAICFLNQESNPRVLLARKVKKLKAETGNQDLESWYDRGLGPQAKAHVIKHGLIRPLKLLFKSPIVALLSLYMALTYGLLYLLFTTITAVFQSTYGWEPEVTGLAYIGLGVGFMIGVGAVAKLSDATLIKLSERNGGVAEPEMRLPTCIFFGCFMTISLFWYGWSTEKHAHWIVPILGMIPFGFGMMGIFIPIQTYLIDAFPEYAASSIAALTSVRSIFGAFLPMAGPEMYKALGLGWGNSLLGFLSIGLLPFLPFIYKYGGVIRNKWPVDLR